MLFRSPAKRETDTMPQWAGSSWYFLRYTDPHNDEALASKEALKYWMPVDWYNGGMEHTTLHLLYSRFWHKFLYDQGVVPCPEPYQKRTSHGMILGENGEKMSKSRGNVVNPDDIVREYGADTLRTYEMFIGAFDLSASWSEDGVKGCRRFLERIWKLQDIMTNEEGYSSDLETKMHQTIKKVSSDYENLKYNTAIAAMMALLNDFTKKGSITKGEYKTLLILLNPVAPHITEELWQIIGGSGYVYEQTWPEYEEAKTVENTVEIAVQINGKTKGTLAIGRDDAKEDVIAKAGIAKELNLSMPTVLANVNDLLEKGVLEETGEYASTGGRKAKSIGINKSYCHAMGILITANHIEMVLVNLGDEIIKKDRIRLKFTAELSYCTEVAQKVKTFLEGELAKDTLLGIGVAIPGIIDQKERIVLKSHALGIENYSLRFLEQALEIPVYFENDANAAMLAEKKQKYPNAIYLSLNHTLGGAFCIDGKLFRGQNQKAGEFGHMILVPGGRKCYCGKSGCADAYCAASVLTQDNRQSLDAFMEKIESGNEKILQKWNEYLDHLAVLISNLRMAYDMDIILGGDVGGVLSDYMIPLGEKVMAYNGFEHDVSYLKNCSYKKEASAVGAAKYFFTKHMVEL